MSNSIRHQELRRLRAKQCQYENRMHQNALRNEKGVLHAKGTMPRIHFRPKEIVQKTRETWFDRLRAHIKALCDKIAKKSRHQVLGS